jgi:HEAT repeat protein
MVRKVLAVVFVALVVGVVGWFAGRHIMRGVAYWRNMTVVRRAEAALADGQDAAALQLLARAGEPGRERLGRLAVTSHNEERWPKFVAALRVSPPGVEQALVEVLQLSPEERLCAAEALAAVGQPQGVQALGQALLAPTDQAHDPAELPSLGEWGAKALGNVARLGPKGASDQAVRLLGGSDAPAARHVLIDVILDRQSPLRTQALQAACWHHGDALQLYFPRLLSDPDPAFRAEAVYQYGALTGSGALSALHSALDDRQVAVRTAAVEAAGLIDGPEADGLLIRALRDPDPHLVQKAVCSLGWRRCKAAEQPLARLYPDASPDLKRDIATALCWVGSPLGPLYKARYERETGQTLALSSEWDG